MPFTTDYYYDVVTIVDDDDLKEWGQYSEDLLIDQYRRNDDIVRKASIPMPDSHDGKLSAKMVEFMKNRDGLLGGETPLLGD